MPPDGVRRVVTAVPRRDGLHRLEVFDGNDETRYDFPDDLAVAVQVGADPVPQLVGDFWFYVPRGTRTLGFYAKTFRGRILLPDGGVAFDLSRKLGHFSCEVPLGADGRFWCACDLNGHFRPLTVPAVLNINPSKCLVPKGVE